MVFTVAASLALALNSPKSGGLRGCRELPAGGIPVGASGARPEFPQDWGTEGVEKELINDLKPHS